MIRDPTQASGPGLRLAVVVPAAGRSALLDGCLEALRAQDRAPDEIVLVDDSPDGDAQPVPGVRLLRSGGRGPYAARNLGWRSTDADVVLFCDVRSRPRPDWARRLAAPFADPEVALAGSEVHIAGGDSLGARVGERHQFFQLHKYLENGFFRPYLPNCNLAARRSDLDAVGGFGEIRSGGDADLCWRILGRPGRRLEAVPEVLMDWIPRDRLRDYVEQNYRYGKSNFALRRAWADRGAPQLAAVPHRLLARRVLRATARVGKAFLLRSGDTLLDQLREGARVAFQVGYRVAADREARATGRKVAVFREAFLPPSETFVRDHLLHLPTWQPVALTTRRVPDGLEVAQVPVLDAGERSLPERVVRWDGFPGARRRQPSLTRAIRRARPAVVHAHFGPDAALVMGPARRAGVPLVVTFHGYDATVHPEILRQRPAGARLVEHWDELLAQAAGIITVSGFLRDELVRRGADPAKLHVIPCGVDTTTLEWSPPPRDGGLLFVGRLVEKKGAADLLDAVAALPHPRPVTIIGEGPLREALTEQARRLGVQVDFLGVRDSAQVRDAMRAASIVVMPSRRAPDGDCEGLPVVSLEASAMGRPVVGYQHSGMVESVDSGRTGLLAPEGDVAALTVLLEQALADPEALERLARNARRHVEDHFELVDCLHRVEQVYEQVT